MFDLVTCLPLSQRAGRECLLLDAGHISNREVRNAFYLEINYFPLNTRVNKGPLNEGFSRYDLIMPQDPW